MYTFMRNVDDTAYIINKVTTWSRVLFEKPPILQLLKKFPAFYGTRRFITVFTRAFH
jgi:hypothetical protein